MVPFSSFASSHWDYGSPRLERYNGVPAIEHHRARPPPGVSSGDAMAEIERSSPELPAGFGLEWSGAVVPGARRRRADAAAVCALGR